MTDEAKLIVNTLRECAVATQCSKCVVICEDNECLFTTTAKMIEALSAELEEVKCERDALKNDLMFATSGDDGLCGICNDQKNAVNGVCRGMYEFVNNSDCFEWRGVKEDRTS